MLKRRFAVVAVLALAAVNVLTIVVLGSPRGGCGGYGYSGTFTGSGYAPVARPDRNQGYSGYSGGYSGYSGYFCTETDLKVGLADRPDPALAGGVVTYRGTILNQGPDFAFDVFVEHVFAPGTKVLEIDAPPGVDCEDYAYYVYCSDFYIRPNHREFVNVTVQLPRTLHSFRDLIVAYSSGFDPNFDDNHDVEMTSILPSADLDLSKLDSPDPVSVGDELTYSLVVRNRGPAKATGVTLTDPLPVGLSVVFVSSTQGDCAVEGALVTCDLGTVNQNGVATVTLVVRPLGPGTLTNTASVTSPVGDPVTTNNTAQQVTQVVP
jgi:uncharacterized repeat protein (TIGR01451 family)